MPWLYLVNSSLHKLLLFVTVTTPEVPQPYPLPTNKILTHDTRHYVDNPTESRANQRPQTGADEIISLIKYLDRDTTRPACYITPHLQLSRLQTSHWCLSNASHCTDRCLPSTTRVYALHNHVGRSVGTHVIILTGYVVSFKFRPLITGETAAGR